MSVYYMNECAVVLPAIGLVDHTTTMLRAVTDDGYSCSMSVYRTPRPAGKSLAELVDENLRRAAIELRAHVLRSRRDIELDGAPAIEVRTEWRGQSSVIHTRQAHLVLDETWLIVSANAPIADRARCDAIVDRALATFRLRRAASGL